MVPALYFYLRHQKNKKQQLDMDALNEIVSSADRASFFFEILTIETFSLHGVCAKLLMNGEECSIDDFVSGRLTIVEKPFGVMIEWTPLEEDGWVIAGDFGSETLLSNSPEAVSRRDGIKKLMFSVDIKDLRSFQCVEPKDGYAWIRLISKDGIGYPMLYFRQGGLSSFTDHLQRYATLKRSAREANLVLFTDERIEALEQSVSILNLNNDLFTRVMTNPYATAMTGLGKVAHFVRDQVIPSMLDIDAVSAEEQIRAINELREQEEVAGNLRLHDDAGYELVTQLVLPDRPVCTREVPITSEKWQQQKCEDGSFKDVHVMKALIFHGGISPSLRREAWKYLLDVYDWKKSTTDNMAMRKDQCCDYYRMKLQWTTINADQESRFIEYANRKALIEKDVARTDRTHPFFGGENNVNIKSLNDILMTYCMYNFDLGYVQGMSDYLSPLLVIMQDEVDAFWAFVGLLKRVHRNFEKDQSTIKKQLMDLRDLVMVVNPRLANYLESHQSDDMYFCFRWMLVTFKREFSFDDTMRLWEVLWTGLPCKNFHLLICVAILDKQMNLIVENQFGLTEILKHVNDLSMHIDLNQTLMSAEAIFHQLAASQDKLPRHICKILSLGDSSEGN